MTVTRRTLRSFRSGERIAKQTIALHCLVCRSVFSANPYDYFMIPDDKPFEHCGEGMKLMVSKVVSEVLAE